MLQINLSKQAEKFLSGLSQKHATQIANKILRLAEDETSCDTRLLKGYEPLKRLKSGDYRCIYTVENNILYISLIGKRNDDEIYKLVRNFLK